MTCENPPVFPRQDLSVQHAQYKINLTNNVKQTGANPWGLGPMIFFQTLKSFLVERVVFVTRYVCLDSIMIRLLPEGTNICQRSMGNFDEGICDPSFSPWILNGNVFR